MLVDSSDNLRHVIKDYLEMNGYLVTDFRDGTEANELFNSYDGLDDKHVITVERINDIDAEFEVYAYNLVGSLIYEWRKEN